MNPASIRGRRVLLKLMEDILTSGAINVSDVFQLISTPDVVSFLHFHRKSSLKAKQARAQVLEKAPVSKTSGDQKWNQRGHWKLQTLNEHGLANIEFKTDVEVKLKGCLLLRLSTEKIAKMYYLTFLISTVPAHVLSVVFPHSTWAVSLSSCSYSVLFPICFLWFASLQRELLHLALKENLYTILSSVFFVVAQLDLSYHRSPLNLFFLRIPAITFIVPGVVMVVTADAALPKARVRLLRTACLVACLSCFYGIPFRPDYLALQPTKDTECILCLELKPSAMAM